MPLREGGVMPADDPIQRAAEAAELTQPTEPTTRLLCGKRVRRKWILVTLDKDKVGPYCSKACAEADAWGPRFRNCEVRRG